MGKRETIKKFYDELESDVKKMVDSAVDSIVSAKKKGGKVVVVTEKVVKDFMEISSKEDMEEILSYLPFKDEMLSDKLGASDLEDWIDFVINKDCEV